MDCDIMATNIRTFNTTEYHHIMTTLLMMYPRTCHLTGMVLGWADELVEQHCGMVYVSTAPGGHHFNIINTQKHQLFCLRHGH